MIELLGIKYISCKEAASRYGYSVNWFRELIYKKESPKFIRIRGRGKILYPLNDIDEWFRKNMISED